MFKKIFISYSRQSEAMARTLANDFKSLGHTVWFDQELSGGQVWWDQILSNICDCDLFVFLLDRKALDSMACKREYGYAAAIGKPILPVLIAEGVSTNLLPSELSQIQFIDYRKQDRNAVLSLARALSDIPLPKPLPDPLPPPPEVPLSYLGNLNQKVNTTSTLSYQEQGALVMDLRRGLRDPETADDARTLLERLRKRQDLFAVIAEEIGELLGNSRPPPGTESNIIVEEIDGLPGGSKPPPVTKSEIITWRERLLGASFGAVAGALFGAISGHSFFISGAAPRAVLYGIVGAITGAISWRRKIAIIMAIAGFVVAFSLSSLEGGPIGAILSAIVGVTIEQEKKKNDVTH